MTTAQIPVFLGLLISCVQVLILSAVLILWLWRRRSKTKLDWLLRFLIAGTYLLWMVFLGNWATWSLHLRWVFLAAFIAAATVSLRRALDAPFYVRNGPLWWFSFGGRVLLLAVFGLFLGVTVQARTYDGEALAIAAPLRGGHYVVAHGGSNPSLNYHSASEGPQTYALDISRANALGAAACGVLPRQLDRYTVYGDTVYSPISGTVVEAVDGLLDLTPPEMNPAQPAGNHVWVRAGNVYLLLAHLKTRSVRVRTGETVSAGDPVGQVGNSGNTTEPHLHIHAVRLEGEVPAGSLLRSGDPVPLLIEGHFLTLNSTF